MSRPLISVLVTVFNRERYLAECLTSISRSDHQDFEVLVVDDASTDRSVEIARAFVSRDQRFKLFANETNLGDYPNRNRAAELARGKYLKYVDSDDSIRPDCLSKLCEPLEADSEPAFSLSYPRPAKLERPALLTPRQAYEVHFRDHQGIFSSGPLLAMIRTSRFRQVGGFQDRARNMGDTLLWLELSSKWPLVLVEDELTVWRRHDGQEYGLIRHVGVENARTHCKLTTAILNQYLVADKCPLLGQDRQRARREIRSQNALRVLWHLRHGRFRLARFEATWFVKETLGRKGSNEPAPSQGSKERSR